MTKEILKRAEVATRTRARARSLARDHVLGHAVDAVDEVGDFFDVFLAAQTGAEVRDELLRTEILEHLRHLSFDAFERRAAFFVQQGWVEVTLNAGGLDAARLGVVTQDVAGDDAVHRGVDGDDVVTGALKGGETVRGIARESQQRHGRVALFQFARNLLHARHGVLVKAFLGDVLAHRLKHLHHVHPSLDLRVEVIDHNVRQNVQQLLRFLGVFFQPSHPRIRVLSRRPADHVIHERPRRRAEPD
mmetsp:Transcript_4695/g.17959  ORF Transcript_4695/g.17959 Transcript_4695/m.17959 type:complete len:246 (+) Transcript_4695:16-753(+)